MNEINYSKETLSQMTSQLNSTITKKDEVITSLLSEIVDLIESCPSDMTISAISTFVISIEWRIVRARMVIFHEISTLHKMLNLKPASEVMVKTMKNRINQLLLYCQRFNEVKDDLQVIQKMVYTSNLSRL